MDILLVVLLQWPTSKRVWVLAPSTIHTFFNGSKTIQTTLTTGQPTRSGLSLPRQAFLPVSIPLIYTALQLALATWTVSFSSSAYSGGLEYTMRDLHVSYNVATLGISLYVLGFALGFVLVHSPPLFQTLIHPSPLLFASMGEVTIFRSSPASLLAHQTSLPFPNSKQRCTAE